MIGLPLIVEVPHARYKGECPLLLAQSIASR
jgi:hypothetical protein